MEVRSSAETAAHIQAGASGPWQEYNGNGWVRALSIRALAHCGAGADDCLYISGSHHQQHTHGVYKKTLLHCDGKPVYIQYNGNSPTEGGEGGEHRKLYLYSPTGRESWMVGRDACRPSGWLEIHSSVQLLSLIHI